jgi:hypothetical protein
MFQFLFAMILVLSCDSIMKSHSNLNPFYSMNSCVLTMFNCNFVVMQVFKFKSHFYLIVTYHIESSTLDDGDYELVLGQDQGFSEDPTQAVEELTEAPNQCSEAPDTPAPNPTQEGKPRYIL